MANPLKSALLILNQSKSYHLFTLQISCLHAMMSWQPWNLGENCVIKVLQKLCREELLQACEQYQFRHDATRFLSENLLLSAARPSEARNVGRRLVSWYRIVSFFSK